MRRVGIWILALAASCAVTYLLWRLLGFSHERCIGFAETSGIWNGLGCLIFAEAAREKYISKKIGVITLIACTLFVLLTLAFLVSIVCIIVYVFPVDYVISLISKSSFNVVRSVAASLMGSTLAGGATLVVFATLQKKEASATSSNG